MNGSNKDNNTLQHMKLNHLRPKPLIGSVVRFLGGPSPIKSLKLSFGGPSFPLNPWIHCGEKGVNFWPWESVTETMELWNFDIMKFVDAMGFCTLKGIPIDIVNTVDVHRSIFENNFQTIFYTCFLCSQVIEQRNRGKHSIDRGEGSPAML